MSCVIYKYTLKQTCENISMCEYIEKLRASINTGVTIISKLYKQEVYIYNKYRICTYRHTKENTLFGFNSNINTTVNNTANNIRQ
jgi:hypothetical protein